MKKMLFYFFIISSFITTPVFANKDTNECLAHFNDHLQDNAAYFNRCNLSDADVPALLSGLSNHPEITALYAYVNSIGDAGAALFAKNKTLEILVIDANQIGNDGISALAQSTIPMLAVGMNKFDVNGFSALAHDKNLVFLAVGNSGMDDIEATILSLNHTIRGLDLSGNPLLSAKGLAILTNNKNLVELDIYNSDVHDDMMTSLSNATSLEILNLMNDQISSAGIKTLVQNNKNLDFIVLQHNNVDDEGAIALTNLAKLNYLDVSHNPIGAAGVAALKNDKTIEHLAVDDPAKIAVIQMLPFTNSLAAGTWHPFLHK